MTTWIGYHIAIYRWLTWLGIQLACVLLGLHLSTLNIMSQIKTEDSMASKCVFLLAARWCSGEKESSQCLLTDCLSLSLSVTLFLSYTLSHSFTHTLTLALSLYLSLRSSVLESEKSKTQHQQVSCLIRAVLCIKICTFSFCVLWMSEERMWSVYGKLVCEWK